MTRANPCLFEVHSAWVSSFWSQWPVRKGQGCCSYFTSLTRPWEVCSASASAAHLPRSAGLWGSSWNTLSSWVQTSPAGSGFPPRPSVGTDGPEQAFAVDGFQWVRRPSPSPTHSLSHLVPALERLPCPPFKVNPEGMTPYPSPGGRPLTLGGPGLVSSFPS